VDRFVIRIGQAVGHVLEFRPDGALEQSPLVVALGEGLSRWYRLQGDNQIVVVHPAQPTRTDIGRRQQSLAAPAYHYLVDPGDGVYVDGRIHHCPRQQAALCDRHSSPFDDISNRHHTETYNIDNLHQK
jgi:hypothetical protein